MYESFFGLRELPFNNTPDPRFFYKTPDHEEALASLIYCVEARKGFVLLTGEIGTGKTLVTRLMLRQLGTRIAFAHVHHAIAGPEALMEAVCAEFELPERSPTTPVQRTRMLHDFLLQQFSQNRPAVLILDEAQHLPVEAFEQLRMIGNLEADDAKLLQIVIVGQPELRTMFAGAQLRQLRQRIFRAFHLKGLSRVDTEAYIRHRLVVAGAEKDIFSADAFDAIHSCSGGFPRLINTLCDNTLLSAFAADRKAPDAAFVSGVYRETMMVEQARGAESPILSRLPVEPVRSGGAVSGHLVHREIESAVMADAERVMMAVDRSAASFQTAGSSGRSSHASDLPEWTNAARDMRGRVETACRRLRELAEWGDRLALRDGKPRKSAVPVAVPVRG